MHNPEHTPPEKRKKSVKIQLKKRQKNVQFRQIFFQKDAKTGDFGKKSELGFLDSGAYPPSCSQEGKKEEDSGAYPPSFVS